MRLNLVAASLHSLALIVWIGGSLTSFFTTGNTTIDKDESKLLWVFSETLSLTLLYIGFFILIYVFWHYGLNVDATIQKQKLKEEKKKEREFEEAKIRIILDELPEEEEKNEV